MIKPKPVLRFGTCSKDCYGACVMHGEWNDQAPEQKLKKVVALKSHPFTQGFFCPKFNNREKLLYHPSRLKIPLMRNGPKGEHRFIPISYSDALDLMATKFLKQIQQNTPNQILAAYYSGNTGLLSCNAPLRLFYCIGASVTTGGICNEGGCAALKQMFGTYSVTSPLQLTNDAAELIVVWFSDLTHNNNHAYHLISKARSRGVHLVVIDYRNTELAKQANLFIPLLPIHVSYLVQYILKKLIIQNQLNLSYIKEHIYNHQELRHWIEQINEKNLATILSNRLESIEIFISLLLKYQNHTIFAVGYGTQKDRYGGMQVQVIALLQVLLQNLGKPGTGLIYSMSDVNHPIINPIIQEITQSNHFPPSHEVEIISLAQALETHQYKVLVIYNFNPCSSLPNQVRLRQALNQPDLFVILLDVFPTETMRYADLVFPMKYDLETDDLVASYYIPGISITQAGPCPYPNCVSNMELFMSFGQYLGTKLGWNTNEIALFQTNSQDLIIKCLSNLSIQQRLLIQRDGYALFLEPESVLYPDLKFPTPSGQIHVNPQIFSLLLPDHDICTNSSEKYPEFILFTPNHSHFLHSQLGELNSRYHSDFESIFISTSRFNQENFIPGQQVEIFNQFGRGTYSIFPLPSISEDIAILFSGGPDKCDINANFFTTDLPEQIGHSGAYNAAKIYIQR